MFGKGRYRLWEIDRMTIPEIELALQDDLEKPLGGSLSPEEQREYAQRRRAMTWTERIADARG